MSFGLIFVGIAFVICARIGVAVYNNLVSLKNQIDRAWTNIEILLKQRFDEIPQIIQVVEQYASYEQKTLQRVIEARNNYSQSSSMGSKIDASNEMSTALKGLVALGEAYPDLKANQSFMQLQNRASELEGQITDRREFFNETVTNFNTRIAQIPDMFFAHFLGYNERQLYRPPAEEMTRPSLKMNVG
ncbi:MAG: LemA family protein [Bdellovibrionaceae bacterium]|nr:LemA family protein [Pseudobdellovibrionaceae bacterium]